MDGQEYLTQIAQDDTRPKRQKDTGGGLGIDFKKILHSKVFIGVVVGLVVLFMVMIITSVMSGSKEDISDLATKLKTEIDTTTEMINKYQDRVKSSTVRSNGASLYSVLSGTGLGLSGWITTVYPDYKGLSEKEEAKLEESKVALDEELFEAKITGKLDWTFSQKMAEQIASILTQEDKIYKQTKDDDLKQILESNYSSLENLYNAFDNYLVGK